MLESSQQNPQATPEEINPDQQQTITQWFTSFPLTFHNLSRSNRLALQVLLCSMSFLLGMGYGQTQEPEKMAIGGTGYGLLSNLPEIPEPPEPIRIKAVGDILPGTNYPSPRLHPQEEQLFTAVAPLLEDAEVVFGNLETTLTDVASASKRMGNGLMFAFRTPPHYSRLLEATGFDVLSVANNHSFDFGKQGFNDTIKHIEQTGMEAIGEKAEISYTQVDEVTIAWIGFSVYPQHNSILEQEQGIALVKKAQDQADFVVLSIHGGAEGTGALNTRDRTEYFYGENRGNLVQFSRTMIDHGADLILGHGPHVPRGLELYKDKLIAYSLGNFMGYQTFSTTSHLGTSLILEVEVNEQGDFLQGKILPLRLNQQGIPAPSSSGESIQLLQHLTQTDFPDTPLEIAADGTILRRD
ncbi:MAG: CapA family protein [Kamptonema sp. SIO4C4]|nr:CapA family protein [Kamptonema sp. SIO4C4]